jgi:hypothetical protein
VSAFGKSGIFCRSRVFKISFSEIVIALPRHFIYRDVAADIFTVLGLHFTLIFEEHDRKQLMQRIAKPPRIEVLSCPFDASSIIAFPRERVTKLWVKRKISTYLYLLYLNTLGSRSFNDLAQYPIFSWVLEDFTGDRPVAARDLAKPMGAQTEARTERFITSYREAMLHYGTHYSHPAAILAHRDRQFASIAKSWRSSSESNQSDVKELVPEFFTIPYFLENPNHVQFGSRSDGTSLDAVVLPPWAKSAVDFVWKMRVSLEESESMHSWIDLIFGYKQRGPAAADALNIFQSLYYDDCVEDASGADREVIDAITQFGQCP